MKRLWIGVVLLVVMLAGGIGMLVFSRQFSLQFTELLDTAAEEALAENWSKAEVLIEKATAQWESCRRFLASFTDHEPVEEVQQLLSRLALFLKSRLAVDFADACRSLSQLCEAIDESHSLKWWSVL